jgi:hypothetical protein
VGTQQGISRRQVLATAAEPPRKLYCIGVVSASIRGKVQPRNGHAWHFAQYLHPTVDLDAIKKYVDPGSADTFRMAATFREMVRTRQEPIPQAEILEVTAVVQAAVKSSQENSRLVELAEVLK